MKQKSLQKQISDHIDWLEEETNRRLDLEERLDKAADCYRAQRAELRRQSQMIAALQDKVKDYKDAHTRHIYTILTQKKEMAELKAKLYDAEHKERT